MVGCYLADKGNERSQGAEVLLLFLPSLSLREHVVDGSLVVARVDLFGCGHGAVSPGGGDSGRLLSGEPLFLSAGCHMWDFVGHADAALQHLLVGVGAALANFARRRVARGGVPRRETSGNGGLGGTVGIIPISLLQVVVVTGLLLRIAIGNAQAVVVVGGGVIASSVGRVGVGNAGVVLQLVMAMMAEDLLGHLLWRANEERGAEIIGSLHQLHFLLLRASGRRGGSQVLLLQHFLESPVALARAHHHFTKVGCNAFGGSGELCKGPLGWECQAGFHLLITIEPATEAGVVGAGRKGLGDEGALDGEIGIGHLFLRGCLHVSQKRADLNELVWILWQQARRSQLHHRIGPRNAQQGLDACHFEKMRLAGSVAVVNELVNPVQPDGLPFFQYFPNIS